MTSSTHGSLKWSYNTRIKSDRNLLPRRKPLPPDDPARLKLDPKVLVVGNFARLRKIKTKDHLNELSRLTLYHQTSDALAKAGLFERGLVRMLWWVPDSIKPYIVPSNYNQNRSGFNVYLDMAFNAVEVAGVRPLPSLIDTEHINKRKRSDLLNALASEQVQQRSRELRLSVPKGRALHKVPITRSVAKAAKRSKSPFTSVATTVDELRSSIDIVSARIDEGEPWIGHSRISKLKYGKQFEAALETLQYPQAATYQEFRFDTRRVSEKGSPGKGPSARYAVLIDLGLRIINLEAGFKNIEDDGADRAVLEQLRERIFDVDRRFHKLFANVGAEINREIRVLIEDEFTYYTPSPLLSWDRRPYEPLQISSKDFYPKAEVALMDFVPKENIDLAVPDLANSNEAADFCSMLLAHMMHTKSQSLPVVLERMAVNAGKDLIPQVPAITDVRKGGRLNPDNVRVRMLTPEMIQGLVAAWFEWPFRPQAWELSFNTSQRPVQEPEGVGKSEESEESS
jgi:mitochondrial transcription factor 1